MLATHSLVLFFYRYKLEDAYQKTGAFGSGAAFALEDGWILARAIEHTRSSAKASAGIPAALEVFNSIRSPYYHKM
jgi:salicylate hydroxylase